VRVIAGELGGRRLRAPRGLSTRPTSDRVREALFMALEPLAGLRIVDLFAGSGAMGIEALSRGGAHADFVESDRNARAVLEENLKALGIESRATVWAFSLPQGLSRMRTTIERADLILLDPPYGGAEATACLRAIDHLELRDTVRIVLESHARDDVPDRFGRIERVRDRQYGETRVSTYRRSDLGPRSEPQGSAS
jgi:16S rRNA (guanine966-N2)-methyltransferase